MKSNDFFEISKRSIPLNNNQLFTKLLIFFTSLFIYINPANSDSNKPIDFHGSFALGAYHVDNDFSGQNRNDVSWQESAIKFGINGEKDNFSYMLDAVGSATFGDGDAAGFTSGDESEIDLENAFIKWQGGEDNKYEISVGSNDFKLGTGFLIWGDTLNLGDTSGERFDRGGAYYLGSSSRKAFRKTAVLRKSTKQSTSTLFYLDSDNEGQGKPELAGIDFFYGDYADFKYNPNTPNISASYFKIFDANTDVFDNFFQNRDGLENYSIRFAQPINQFRVSGEYVKQSNNGTGSADVDADGWYLQANYSIGKEYWQPTIKYRYSSFSGDNPNTNENEAFDPLFYGYNGDNENGYGTWFQGEIAGNFTGPFNTNSNIQYFGIVTNATKTISLGMHYFDFESDHPNPASLSDKFGEEIDLTITYYKENNSGQYLWLSGFLGRFNPDDDAIEATGINDNSYFAGLNLVLNF